MLSVKRYKIAQIWTFCLKIFNQALIYFDLQCISFDLPMQCFQHN